MSKSGRRLTLWSLGGLLVLIGLVLVIGGVWLAVLGGSLYYLLAGCACLVSGFWIARGDRKGLWLYTALFVATVIWSLFEAGTSFWLLLPRVAGPLVLQVYMLMPWVRKALGMGGMAPGTARKTALAAGAMAVIAGGGMLLREGTGLAQPAVVGGSAAATQWSDYAGNKAGTRFSPAAPIARHRPAEPSR